MMAAMRGTLQLPLEQRPPFKGTICVEGTGYIHEFECSTRSYQLLMEHIGTNGAERTLFVQEICKEGEPTRLIGFFCEEERRLFRQLITVKRVGARGALGICGIDAPNHVMQAIRMQRSDYLCQAPGVGRSSADKICLALEGRFQ